MKQDYKGQTNKRMNLEQTTFMISIKSGRSWELDLEQSKVTSEESLS